jgi:hypothetical protein
MNLWIVERITKFLPSTFRTLSSTSRFYTIISDASMKGIIHARLAFASGEYKTQFLLSAPARMNSQTVFRTLRAKATYPSTLVASCIVSCTSSDTGDRVQEQVAIKQHLSHTLRSSR